MAHKVRSCMPCRSRKVKCDGHPGKTDQCGPCSRARTLLHCTYDESIYVEHRSQKHTLRRGEACVPCRKKKKRCNAARPSCDICRRVGKEDDCRYSDKASPPLRPPPSQRLRKIVSAVSQPDASDTDLDTTEPQTEPHIESPVEEIRSPSSLALVHPSVSSSPTLGLNLTYSFPSTDVLLPDFVDHFNWLVPNPMYGEYDYPTDDDPFLAALSNVSPTDMDMTFRLFFLNHRLQIGFQFPTAKQHAIIFGDLSHTVIHPFFIHFAHLFGCNLYQERIGEYAFLYTICTYLQSTQEALATIREEDDPLAFAEACHFMAIFCLYNHHVFLGQEYLKMALRTIQIHAIRFVPRFSEQHPQAVSAVTEEDAERVVFLGQVLYLEMHCNLLQLLDKRTADLCIDLKKQFISDLPQAYPVLAQTCPMTVRVRAVIFGADSIRLLVMYRTRALASGAWLSSCHNFLRKMSVHVDGVTTQLAYCEQTRHVNGTILLQYSSCLGYVILAELNRVLLKHQLHPYFPLLRDCQITCRNALMAIVHATQQMNLANDFAYMERLFETGIQSSCPKTQVDESWSNALTAAWPQLQPDSVFRNSTILLMAHLQDKLASLRLDH